MQPHHLTPLIALILVTLLSAACDDDGESPPLTFSGGDPSAATADDDQADESGESGESDESGESADSDSRGAAPAEAPAIDLPHGSDEQQNQLVQGRTAFLQGDLDTAAERFEALARERPLTRESVSAAVALAQIYAETDRGDEALELFAELEEDVAHIPEVLFTLAGIYGDMGDARRALHAYDRAYALNQDYIFILPQMAEILLAEGKEDEAGQLLAKYEERIAQMANLLESPDDADDADRLYLVDILGMLHDERAHEALENALADPNAEVRGAAAIALGELRITTARQAIEDLAVDDEDPAVRDAAKLALAELDRVQ